MPARQLLEPVVQHSGSRCDRLPQSTESLKAEANAKMAVDSSVIDNMQKQLHKAEAMLSSCVKSVEAAWDLSAQRLTEFDQKLSALDIRLVELSQKHEDYEMPEADTQTIRLGTLENRLEELVKRLETPPQPLPLETLDFLNHRVASLSERLAAEARVREAQFRRLETLLSQSPQCSIESQAQQGSRMTGTDTGTTLTREAFSMPTLGTRNSFLDVVDGTAERPVSQLSMESTEKYRSERGLSRAPTPRTYRPFTPRVEPPSRRFESPSPVLPQYRRAAASASPVRRLDASIDPVSPVPGFVSLLPHHVKAQTQATQVTQPSKACLQEYLVAKPEPLAAVSVQAFALETQRRPNVS